jgi:hypothetical protein
MFPPNCNGSDIPYLFDLCAMVFEADFVADRMSVQCSVGLLNYNCKRNVDKRS